jgi:hypothetical protein
MESTFSVFIRKKFVSLLLQAYCLLMRHFWSLRSRKMNYIHAVKLLFFYIHIIYYNDYSIIL